MHHTPEKLLLAAFAAAAAPFASASEKPVRDSILAGQSNMVGLSVVPADRERRPDVVLIMADDMGFSDLGSYGGEINTPHLDELAHNGLRFRSFYNQARCMPTRASLLTGRYAHQAGLGAMAGDRGPGQPGYRGNINHESVTLAEALRVNGYRNYLAGKWHVTRHDGPDEPVENRFNWPSQRGFDRFYGTIIGAGSFYGPHTLTRGNRNVDDGLWFPGRVWSPEPDVELPVRDDGQFYYTDVITETSVQFIHEHERLHGDEPMFLYVSHVAPHWPLHAPEEEIEPYLDVYRAGWDEVRQQRYERMVRMGVIDARWALPERPDKVAAWEGLSISDMPDEVRSAMQARDMDLKEELARRMATYAAMVDRMDQGIGKIVEALKATDRFDHTLIVFLSDNGASAESPPYGFGWDRIEHTGVRTGEPQSYTSYGAAWAHVSNTPFRWWKMFNHEGGVATPFIVHWPAGIQTRGEWRDQIGHIIDVMPTLMEVTGSTYPARYGGHDIAPMEGVSLVPSFDEDASLGREDMLYFEHGRHRAVRDGRWKLVTPNRQDREAWKLYDMEADRVETRDLAAEHPERVQYMRDAWHAWAKRAHVFRN